MGGRKFLDRRENREARSHPNDISLRRMPTIIHNGERLFLTKTRTSMELGGSKDLCTHEKI